MFYSEIAAPEARLVPIGAGFPTHGESGEATDLDEQQNPWPAPILILT